MVPIAAQVPREIKRARSEHSIFRRRERNRIFKGLGGIANDDYFFCKMARHFAQQRCGNGARLSRLRQNYALGAREKEACNFVHSLVAHRAVHKKNAATGKIFFPELGKRSRARGIVRAIQINGGMIAKALETSGPMNISDAALDCVVIYSKAALR